MGTDWWSHKGAMRSLCWRLISARSNAPQPSHTDLTSLCPRRGREKLSRSQPWANGLTSGQVKTPWSRRAAPLASLKAKGLQGKGGMIAQLLPQVLGQKSRFLWIGLPGHTIFTCAWVYKSDHYRRQAPRSWITFAVTGRAGMCLICFHHGYCYVLFCK